MQDTVLSFLCEYVLLVTEKHNRIYNFSALLDQKYYTRKAEMSSYLILKGVILISVHTLLHWPEPLKHGG